jgi:hypothetical protein
MCNPASFIITKGFKVFWSKRTDGHTDIRKEHGVPENDELQIKSVQVEITPPDGKFETPLKDWVFRTDQDLLPDWWDAKQAESACRVALEDWAAFRLVRVGEERDVNEGDYVSAVCGGTVNEVRGGTVNEVYGGMVNAVYGGTVNAVRGGMVNAVYGGTVNAVYGGTVNAVCGGTVNAVYGGTVNAVCGGTVSFRMNFSVKLYGFISVIIDRTKSKARCIVGTDKERIVKSR